MHRQCGGSVGRESDGVSEPTQPVDNPSHNASAHWAPVGYRRPTPRMLNQSYWHVTGATQCSWRPPCVQ